VGQDSDGVVAVSWVLGFIHGIVPTEVKKEI